jgi:hypothetical protein
VAAQLHRRSLTEGGEFVKVQQHTFYGQAWIAEADASITFDCSGSRKVTWSEIRVARAGHADHFCIFVTAHNVLPIDEDLK